MQRRPQDPPYILTDINVMKDQIASSVFAGAQEATRLLTKGGSATIDPYTEEVVWTAADTWTNASGILGTIEEEDMLLSVNGQVKVGMTKVTYPWPAVSSVIVDPIPQIQISGADLPSSGVIMNVVAMHIDMVADTPMFVDFALQDNNG